MKNEIQISITQMAQGGEGMGEHQGKKVFVPYSLPGDELLVRWVENKKDFARAEIVEILKASADRVSPPCPYFYRCGGCQWQHVSDEAQLLFKNDLLNQALKRIAKIPNPRLLEPLASPQVWNYRNRIRLQSNEDGEVGFYQSTSHQLVPIDRCLIADEKLNEKIPEAKALAQKWIQKGLKPQEIELNLKSLQTLENEKSMEEMNFSQVNSAQNETLKKRVLETLELHREKRVLELYAGEGNFSFAIAAQAQSLTAVEMEEGAVEKARKRLQREHRRNLDFIQSSSFRALENLKRKGESFDSVLLDPPRFGAEEALKGMASLGIAHVVYVSCDPATLARDVKILLDLGYEHEFSQVIDMFPQTYHLESLTSLRKSDKSLEK